MKATKRQINKIALMWAAAVINNFGTDSFTDEFESDVEVVQRTQVIAYRILGDLPMMESLEEIINYVMDENIKL